MRVTDVGIKRHCYDASCSCRPVVAIHVVACDVANCHVAADLLRTQPRALPGFHALMLASSLPWRVLGPEDYHQVAGSEAAALFPHRLADPWLCMGAVTGADTTKAPAIFISYMVWSCYKMAQ
ncbi:hypothetical protein NDU88_004353 [Pleurodeles waltl]|uniref:Uncharacterized protein n=1 Tax=Pleurodeles waltl TaxID=8319 RepID=A0AAV7TTZ2_PLEWA|nr:hypothetical protein NDU88_004353 [Pleurodeles waltl]